MGTAGQSITLANSIIGVGILAMPFCFQQCGVLLAALILLIMGLISRLCCYFLLKSALLARRRNFEYLAFHVFGPAGKFAVEVGIIGFLMGTCIAYFVVVGDLGPQIIAKLFNINQSDILRTSIMVLVSLLCVLPLGLLRNVDSFSNVSAATIGFYFCLVMKVIAEAASQLLNGEWHTRVEMWKPSGVLQCVPIFSMALFCQTQLFEIFESLPSLSLEKMNLVTKNALNICSGVYFTLGVFGYIAFCSQQISGNILMSLSPTLASDVIKLGFVMSLAFSFPLIIFPCRASLYSLLYKKVHSSHHDHIINHSIPERSFRCITVAIIAVSLFISLLIPNIELVLGLVGSTIGVLICIVFPAACFVNVTFKNTNERVLAKGTIVFGLIIMILGTYANLQAAESQKDKYDYRYITQEKIDKLVEDFFEKMDKPQDVKPIEKNDLKSSEIKVNEKEFEVQPPNPIPPESQSNEKLHNNEEHILKAELKEVLPEPEKDTADKVSETHPKNLKKNTEAKLNKPENNVNIENKEEKQPEEKIKTATNEEKNNNNIIKQQKLMETIKQHGEEQKELIKEQKEILDEIMKTKKEQQEQKSEVESLAAKRIAMESIQKIADVAIQSLGGGSEKPVGAIEQNKAEHIEKLADKAVKEIEKKALETIEAIKEINKAESLDNRPVALNNINVPQNQKVEAVNQPVANNQNVPQVPIPELKQNVQANSLNGAQNVNNVAKPSVDQPAIVQNNELNKQPEPVNVPKPINNQQLSQNMANNGQQAQNIQQQAQIQQLQQQSLNQQPVVNGQQQVQQPIVNAQQPVVNIQQPVVQPSPNDNQARKDVKEPIQQPAKNIEPLKSQAENIPKLEDKQLSNQNQPVENNLKEDKQVKHSHSPDEPQSYKQGEGVQNGPDIGQINDMIKNIPIPLSKESLNKIQAAVKPQSQLYIKEQNGAKDNNDAAIRQKREVVDCTEKSVLKPEDRQICEKLVNVPQFKTDVKDDFLKNDLNEIGLPKNLLLDSNLIHIGRSLKSYDVPDKKR